MPEKTTIQLTHDQTSALYDLVEFRLLTADSDPQLLPELEVDEIYSLVGVLVVLRRVRNENL